MNKRKFKPGDTVRYKYHREWSDELSGKDLTVTGKEDLGGTEYIRIEDKAGLTWLVTPDDISKDPFKSSAHHRGYPQTTRAPGSTVKESLDALAALEDDYFGGHWLDKINCEHKPVDMGFPSKKCWCTQCDADIEWSDHHNKWRVV